MLNNLTLVGSSLIGCNEQLLKLFSWQSMRQHNQRQQSLDMDFCRCTQLANQIFFLGFFSFVFVLFFPMCFFVFWFWGLLPFWGFVGTGEGEGGQTAGVKPRLPPCAFQWALLCFFFFFWGKSLLCFFDRHCYLHLEYQLISQPQIKGRRIQITRLVNMQKNVTKFTELSYRQIPHDYLNISSSKIKKMIRDNR